MSIGKTSQFKRNVQFTSHIPFEDKLQGWFAQLERRSLYREGYIEVHNRETAKPFKWTKDAKSILLAVERAKNALPN